MENFYTIQELAEKLKVNKMTIYRYIKSNKLVAYKLGKNLRIKESDFSKFLESKKVK